MGSHPIFAEQLKFFSFALKLVIATQVWASVA
jgi:hypothetical protein